MMDRKPDNDKLEPVSEEQLERFLDGDSQVSQAYRDADQAEPPAALDRTILAQARKQVKTPVLDTGSFSFWRHWMRPVTIVLSIGACLAVVLEIMNTVTPAPGLSKLDGMLANEEARDEIKSGLITLPQASRPEAATMTADSPAKMATEMQAQRSVRPDAAFDVIVPEQELVVTARKREATPQEVPMAVSAFASRDLQKSAKADTGRIEEIVMDADASFATNALEAWESGAKPSVKVWLAGIQTMIEDGEADFASYELERMAKVYPDASAQFREDKQLPLYISGNGAMLEEIMVTPRMEQPPEPTADIADAWIWFAGIDWLYETGASEAADAETEKFRQIYPNF
jgi:hypothetical protein